MASALESSLREVAAAIRSREISPVELTRNCLDRIAEDEPRLNAYVRITADRAMATAREAERADHGLDKADAP